MANPFTTPTRGTAKIRERVEGGEELNFQKHKFPSLDPDTITSEKGQVATLLIHLGVLLIVSCIPCAAF